MENKNMSCEQAPPSTSDGNVKLDRQLCGELSMEDSKDEIIDESEQETVDERSVEDLLRELSEKDEVIANLKHELESFEDKYKRVYADFENSKRRLHKDREVALEYANEALARDLLAGFDTLEAAMKSNVDNDEVYSGLKLTYDLLLKTLGKYGVELISIDCDFDPTLHECVMQVCDETKAEGAIASVLQTGYKYKNRVLRPALVSVVKK